MHAERMQSPSSDNKASGFCWLPDTVVACHARQRVAVAGARGRGWRDGVARGRARVRVAGAGTRQPIPNSLCPRFKGVKQQALAFRCVGREREPPSLVRLCQRFSATSFSLHATSHKLHQTSQNFTTSQ